jgi:hypothetical protein
MEWSEVIHRQSFFDDERGGEIERPGAAHGKIVYRAVDGKLADVASREEERMHDIAVGGEGQPFGPDREHCPVMHLFQSGVAKFREEELLDQFVCEFPAAAVCEQHLFVLCDGKRAGVSFECEFLVRHGAPCVRLRRQQSCDVNTLTAREQDAGCSMPDSGVGSVYREKSCAASEMWLLPFVFGHCGLLIKTFPVCSGTGNYSVMTLFP